MMDIQELSDFPLTLPLDRIKSRLKIPRNADNREHQRIIQRAFAMVEPVARFIHVSCGTTEGVVQLPDEWTIRSRSLAKHLVSCDKVTLMGVTIGPAIEDEIETLNRTNKLLEPIILDAVGSECAEEAARYVSRFVEPEISRSGCTPTRRFSPGYGDLNLAVQSNFFQLLKLSEIGITLLKSFLMIPQKSVTAFIGWQH